MRKYQNDDDYGDWKHEENKQRRMDDECNCKQCEHGICLLAICKECDAIALQKIKDTLNDD